MRQKVEQNQVEITATFGELRNGFSVKEHLDRLAYLRWGAIDVALNRRNTAYVCFQYPSGGLWYWLIGKVVVNGFTGEARIELREQLSKTTMPLGDDAEITVFIYLASPKAN